MLDHFVGEEFVGFGRARVRIDGGGISEDEVDAEREGKVQR